VFWIALLMGAAPVEAPVWLNRPNGHDVAQAYPKQAWDDQLVGRAELSCSVSSDGRLTDCNRMGEEPEGKGFGEAAMRLAEKFLMSPTDGDGQPVEGRAYQLKIRFVLPGFSATPVAKEFVVRRDAGPFGEVLINCRTALGARLDNCQMQQAPTQELAAAALAFWDELNVGDAAPPALPGAYGRVAISITFRPSEPP